jgi:hypothetical protein
MLLLLLSGVSSSKTFAINECSGALSLFEKLSRHLKKLNPDVRGLTSSNGSKT